MDDNFSNSSNKKRTQENQEVTFELSDRHAAKKRKKAKDLKNKQKDKEKHFNKSKLDRYN